MAPQRSGWRLFARVRVDVRRLLEARPGRVEVGWGHTSLLECELVKIAWEFARNKLRSFCGGEARIDGKQKDG
jgi:hypothetical protein